MMAECSKVNSTVEEMKDIPTEESHISRLTNEISTYRRILPINIEAENEALEKVAAAFIYENGTNPTLLHFSDPYIVWAFFHRYSFLFATMTRNRIIHALSECEYLCSNVRTEMKVVSLSGGPVGDAIGLLSALYGRSTVKLTIVHKLPDFQRYMKIMQDLICRGSFGNISDVLKNPSEDMTFLCHDVSSTDKDADFSSAMNTADLVLMVGLLNFLQDDGPRVTAAEKIIQDMKVGAILLFIDSPKFEKILTEGQLPTYKQYIILEEKYRNCLKWIYTSELDLYFRPYLKKMMGHFKDFPAYSNKQISVFEKIEFSQN